LLKVDVGEPLAAGRGSAQRRHSSGQFVALNVAKVLAEDRVPEHCPPPRLQLESGYRGRRRLSSQISRDLPGDSESTAKPAQTAGPVGPHIRSEREPTLVGQRVDR